MSESSFLLAHVLSRWTAQWRGRGSSVCVDLPPSLISRGEEGSTSGVLACRMACRVSSAVGALEDVGLGAVVVCAACGADGCRGGHGVGVAKGVGAA
jgi:hypothetical protein